MGEIKVTLENWLGQVHFETTQEKIDEFNEEYYDAFDELCEENNYTEYVSTFCFDPYLIFEPGGEFVVVAQFSLYDGETGAIGFEIEFQNCEVPDELNKYLYDGYWLFIDQGTRKIITDTKISEKLSAISLGEGDCEIDNNGYGVLRFKDFDWRKFINQYL
tara:strand:- start:272 stop:754 length:483 start_codon:yes stop_codon:yes gene_type:complete